MPMKAKFFIEGKKVELKGVKDAQKNGISIIHQELVLVPYITVAENIFLEERSVFRDSGRPCKNDKRCTGSA